MTMERLVLAVAVLTAVGFGFYEHGAHAASPGASFMGATGAVDAKGNATVWVFGTDRTIRVCSALIPAAADQRPTCSKSATLT